MRHINRAAPVEARHTMSSANHHAGQPLWAITSYFNPMRYKRKLANYRLFREHLPLPLLTVELSFGANDFDLREGEADILIQLRGGDVLWQKERLLNVALRALPSECTKVVWLDCDVVFGGGGWAEEVSGLLDEFVLVQAFSRVHHLPRDLPLGEASLVAAEFSQASTASAIASGVSARTCLSRPARPRIQDAYSPGFAWASRRELLDEHGFYDALIMGGGDHAMACAAYGIFDVVMRYSMNERQSEHYLGWAKPFFESVRGAASFADYELFHLWHGEMRYRRYRKRHEGLGHFQFDPYEDITIAENGSWRWASDKPQMHGWVREYFASRREDGLLSYRRSKHGRYE